jgi:predicted MFS family arabinose efflux permease
MKANKRLFLLIYIVTFHIIIQVLTVVRSGQGFSYHKGVSRSMENSFRRVLGLQLSHIFGETFAWGFIYLHAAQSDLSELEIAVFFVVMMGSAAASFAVINRPVPTGRSMTIGLALKLIGLFIAIDIAWFGNLLVAAVVWGLYIMLFWVPYNVVFLRMTTYDDRAFRSTLLFAMFAAASAIFPLVGGELLELHGFWLLVVLATPVLAIGGWLAWATPWGEAMDFDLRRALREGRRISPLVTLEGIWQGIFWVAVPIGTLRMVDQGSEYGAFLAFLGIMSGMASIAAGRWSDRAKDRRLPLVVSSMGVIAFTLVVPSAEGDLTHWSLAVGAVFFFSYMMMAFTFTLVTELGPGIDDSMGLREVLFNAGRVLGSVLFIATLLLDLDLVWPIIAASMVVALMLVLYLRAMGIGGRALTTVQGPR